MSTKPDAQLLREYANDANEGAFREIVARHADMVYSSALRQVGSPDLAGDVAQNVFRDLAHKARSVLGKMHEHASLAGWLFRGTRFEALNLIRSAQRREHHERQAMQGLTPNAEPAPDWERLCGVLDEAMTDLDKADHEAVLLRYFNNQNLRQVGVAFGISDDAAQKRVTRALETLRRALARRGIRTATEALAIALAANAVQAAPAGIAAAIGTGTLAAAVVQTSIVHGTAKAIAMTSMQKAIIGTMLAATVCTGVFEAAKASRLAAENQALKAQNGQVSQERDAALSKAAASVPAGEGSAEESRELLRLRGEVGVLRRQTNELGRLHQENQRLMAAMAKSNPPETPSDSDSYSEAQKQIAEVKMNDAKQLVLAMLMYAGDHQDQLPSELSQATNYLGGANNPWPSTNSFELLIQGTALTNISEPSKTIAIRETNPWFSHGKWIKTYGFADGHVEVRPEPPEGFEGWEKQHGLVAKGP